MYSFAQRNDTKVYDEPLYAHYLANTTAKEYHPGVEEILAADENDGQKVIDEMLSNTAAPVLFYKQMTHHLLDLDRSFMSSVQHILLTRDPKEMLPSFAAVIENPKLADTGYQHHNDLVDYFEKNDIPFTVIDSKRVLLNPKSQLQQLCTNLGIEFQEAMLSWKKGPREEDGVWAKYWYNSIHNSTGFMEYKAKEQVFPDQLRPLLDECMPYYERLKALAI
tara:strand:+ start:808 stop:1470 length:663 start_codon:yes stop_codon:yes gene_type:complete